MSYDIDFINEYNNYYPFERYIVKTPKSINCLFDDVQLTELFIPSTETTTTQVNDDDIYVKLKCGDVEFRMAYYDFESYIREEIRNIIINDFGLYEFECLYVENEDCSLLIKALKEQFNLITNKYGECKIKDNFMIKKTIELLKQL